MTDRLTVERISPGPYLEMFSRTDRDGWKTWGNQTGTFNEQEKQP